MIILDFFYLILLQAVSETSNPQLSISSLLSSFIKSHGRALLRRSIGSMDPSPKVYACETKIVQAQLKHPPHALCLRIPSEPHGVGKEQFSNGS